MTRPDGEATVAPGDGAPTSPLRTFALCCAAFALLAFVVYRPALDGPFVSDDLHFLAANPYVQQGDWRGLLDPRSDARFYAGGSYQPVAQLALALEWRLFGSSTGGYHRVNLALHALNSALLVWLLLASGVPRLGALLAGAVFALHPANVEAVAWISQIRSLLGLGLALLALLLLRVRPLASVPAFALALLSKSIAAFALPMAAALWWTGARPATRRVGLAVALWLGVFAAFAPLEWSGISAHPPPHARAFPDLATHLRTVTAIGARYLGMAATSYGTAAFHEPEPVRSATDPWWLAGLALAPLLLWRIVAGLRQRREEAAWWIGAAAAFAPVSQVFPFFFGMADRYLYFILPGLLGGSLLAGRALIEQLSRRAPDGRGAALLRRAAAATAVALTLLFGLRSGARAQLWQSEQRLVQDAAGQYRDGMLFHYLAALAWLERGDRDQALAHLVVCGLRGAYVIRTFYNDPQLAPLYSDPRFQQLVREFAILRVQLLEERGAVDQPSLYALANAYARLGRLDRALQATERALRAGGPLQEQLADLDEELREDLTRRQRTGAEPDGTALAATRALDADDALRRLEALVSEGGALPRPALPTP